VAWSWWLWCDDGDDDDVGEEMMKMGMRVRMLVSWRWCTGSGGSKVGDGWSPKVGRSGGAGISSEKERSGRECVCVCRI
nr:hypothetical protein [Tanacetum cinerariifolium]